jgi:hypothetical protein
MFSFLLVLIVVGVLLYILNTLIPMDNRIKTCINAVVLLAVFVYILEGFGVIPAGSFPHFRG